MSTKNDKEIEINYNKVDKIKEVRLTKEEVIIEMVNGEIYTASPKYIDGYMRRNFEYVLFGATLNRIKNGCWLFENVETNT